MRQAVGGPERPWRLSPQSMEQAKRQHGALWARPRSPEKVGAEIRWETIPARRCPESAEVAQNLKLWGRPPDSKRRAAKRQEIPRATVCGWKTTRLAGFWCVSRSWPAAASNARPVRTCCPALIDWASVFTP